MCARNDSPRPKNRLFAPAGDDGASLLDNVRCLWPDTPWKQPMPQKLDSKVVDSVSAARIAEAIERWYFGNQKDLADVLGCTNTTITRWKRGISKPKHLSRLVLNFCDLTGVDPWSLWKSKLTITHQPKERLSKSKTHADTDPLDEKISFLRQTNSSIALTVFVENLFQQELERLRKTRS